jgi:sulfate adenylyltransferase
MMYRLATKRVFNQACRRFASTSVFGADGRTAPHGGVLVNQLVASKEEASKALAACDAELVINDRQSCDVECLMNGAFSPLDGFMNRDTYNGVVSNMRLPGSNLLFGLPVTMDVTAQRDDLKVLVVVCLRGRVGIQTLI